jgi:hypothetical protein
MARKKKDTPDRDQPVVTVSPTYNAWIIRLGKEAHYGNFTVVIHDRSAQLGTVREGDGLLLVAADTSRPIAFARIFRKRSTASETIFHFDGIAHVDQGFDLATLGISTPPDATVTRLECPIFEKALKMACGLDFATFPILAGNDAQEYAHIRELLQQAVVDDLLGPANGPDEEIVGMSVRDRYLVGKLAPLTLNMEDSPDKNTDDAEDTGGDTEPYAGRLEPGEEFASTEGTVESDDEPGQATNAAMNRSIVPASLGFTFCVEGAVESLELHATWGRYERCESERVDQKTGKPLRAWKRIPAGGSVTVSLKDGLIGPFTVDAACPQVKVRGSVGKLSPTGDRLVTLFLVNGQSLPKQNQDRAWIFQPELVVHAQDNRPIFRRRPVFKTDGDDDERRALEMIYRQRVEFAVGHGVSVHAMTADDDDEHAVDIRTLVIPQYEVPITETPGSEEEDRPAMRSMFEDGSLDMERLATLDRTAVIATLDVLTGDYASWIAGQERRIGKAVVGHDEAAKESLDRCREVLARLQEGIAVLGSDDKALEAFRFANRAMAGQRIHTIYALQKRRGEKSDLQSLDIPENRSWRPFQLAFILLSIPALADPTHRDRTQPVDAYADLLWFPTGGGKTEAYLGLAAFTMAIRRLQGNLGDRDAGRGLAVVMRYTLRLLTIQQFQRATTLICAMEVLRRADPTKWGKEPFTVGLWVGQSVTPNTTKDSAEAIERERNGGGGTGSTPAQFTTCPWCGAEIVAGRDIEVDRDLGKTIIYCGDKLGECEFSPNKSKDFGLPVSVIDEEIYRRPTTMLIATVDKFAMMAWRGQVRTLFGQVTEECPRHGLLWPDADCKGKHPKRGKLPSTKVEKIQPLRPPDLIIQDEFHLIGGPLGTMVGLYETAVDALSTWKIGDRAIRPKIVASTATVRKAAAQVNDVFLRRVAVFPPHGLDVEDNFFSIQRPIDKKPGRRYLGICSPGSSRPAILIRVYVALMTASQSLYRHFGQLADPYMTLVGYFNSLRELGGTKRLTEDDIQTRSFRVQMSDIVRPGLTQRSVKNITELTSRVSNKEIPKTLDRLEVKFKESWEEGETQAIDIVLATNMLSVGVDVNRLGLMAVNGQPKNTAEYIQATSRVGRSFPGLILTTLAWSRPRDLSHYETFEHYHATFYKHVEAQSVTPFSPRALDRGLTGMMVSILRLEDDGLNPNLGAGQFDRTSQQFVDIVKKEIADRAWKVKDKLAKQHVESMVATRVDRWVKEAGRPGRRLGYEPERGDVAALLKKPDANAWDEFTVPMSMREVEPGVTLFLDMVKLTDLPAWKAAVGGGQNGDNA